MANEHMISTYTIEKGYAFSLVNPEGEAVISSSKFPRVNRDYIKSILEWYMPASKQNGPDIVRNSVPPNLRDATLLDARTATPLSEREFAKVITALKGK